MKKTTIVRTIIFVIAIINFILHQTGHNVFNIEESDIYNILDTAISVAIFVLTFWKNNSFTKNAIKADKYLEELKELQSEDE